MANYASPGPSAGGTAESKKITFRFCADCSNLLYPRENPDDRNSLQFACRTCNYSMEADTSCIYRNEMSNTAAETAGVTSDLGQDPTVSFASIHRDTSPHQHHPSLGNVKPSVDVEGVSMTAGDNEPYFCTMCGQEVACGVCGKVAYDAGLFVEVDDEDPHRRLHATRPIEIQFDTAKGYGVNDKN